MCLSLLKIFLRYLEKGNPVAVDLSSSRFQTRVVHYLFFGISLFYDLELVKKSVFQPPTTKPGNLGPRTGKTVRITPSSTVASGFEGGFAHMAQGAHKSVHVSTSTFSSLSMTGGPHFYSPTAAASSPTAATA